MPTVEDAVTGEWKRVSFTDDEVTRFSDRARSDLHRSAESGSRLMADQRRRLAELERQQAKLLNAYMAGALPVDLLKQRQDRVGIELADAKRLIQSTQTNSDEISARLEQVIALLRDAEKLYAAAGDEARQVLNQAVFGTFSINRADEGIAAGQITADAPLNPVVDVVVRIPDRNERTLGELSLAEGSILTQLAETEGFEPSMGF